MYKELQNRYLATALDILLVVISHEQLDFFKSQSSWKIVFIHTDVFPSLGITRTRKYMPGKTRKRLIINLIAILSL